MAGGTTAGSHCCQPGPCFAEGWWCQGSRLLRQQYLALCPFICRLSRCSVHLCLLPCQLNLSYSFHFLLLRLPDKLFFLMQPLLGSLHFLHLQLVLLQVEMASCNHGLQLCHLSLQLCSSHQRLLSLLTCALCTLVCIPGQFCLKRCLLLQLLRLLLQLLQGLLRGLQLPLQLGLLLIVSSLLLLQLLGSSPLYVLLLNSGPGRSLPGLHLSFAFSQLQ